MGLLGPLPRLPAASEAQVGLCFSFWGPSKNGRTTEGRPWAAPGLPRGQQVRATVPVSSPGSSVCSGRLRPPDSPCLAPACHAIPEPQPTWSGAHLEHQPWVLVGAQDSSLLT